MDRIITVNVVSSGFNMYGEQEDTMTPYRCWARVLTWTVRRKRKRGASGIPDGAIGIYAGLPRLPHNRPVGCKWLTLV